MILDTELLDEEDNSLFLPAFVCSGGWNVNMPKAVSGIK